VAFTARSHRQLGAPQRLRRGCGVASLAAVASGQAAIALLCNLGLFRAQVWVSERAPGRRFGRAVRVSGVEAEGTRSAAVNITATGPVCVVWDHIVGNVFNAMVVRTEVKGAAAGSRFLAPTWQTGRYPARLNGQQTAAGSPSGMRPSGTRIAPKPGPSPFRKRPPARPRRATRGQRHTGPRDSRLEYRAPGASRRTVRKQQYGPSAVGSAATISSPD
jgi:hypothetical protein